MGICLLFITYGLNIIIKQVDLLLQLLVEHDLMAPGAALVVLEG